MDDAPSGVAFRLVIFFTPSWKIYMLGESFTHATEIYYFDTRTRLGDKIVSRKLRDLSHE